jgi:hypothetical protein
LFNFFGLKQGWQKFLERVAELPTIFGEILSRLHP